MASGGLGHCGSSARCRSLPYRARRQFGIAEPWSQTLDFLIVRCILRGSEFGALHANFIESDTSTHDVAPARELTVAGSALPEADWADLRIARTHKPPAGILAGGFLLFGAVYARRHVQSDR